MNTSTKTRRDSISTRVISVSLQSEKLLFTVELYRNIFKQFVVASALQTITPKMTFDVVHLNWLQFQNKRFYAPKIYNFVGQSVKFIPRQPELKYLMRVGGLTRKKRYCSIFSWFSACSCKCLQQPGRIRALSTENNGS